MAGRLANGAAEVMGDAAEAVGALYRAHVKSPLRETLRGAFRGAQRMIPLLTEEEDEYEKDRG